MTHVHTVRIYYEDTDHSGVVYHANYLKYFERAREHLLGPTELVRLLDEEGIGFVVYKAALTYKAGATFGEVLEVRTTPTVESEYRVSFQQNAHRQLDGELLVEGAVDLVCVDANKQLVKLPSSVAVGL
jgi:acyl-CoA thioester hydrolase